MIGSLDDCMTALSERRTNACVLVEAITADETPALFTLKLGERAAADAALADAARTEGDARPLLGVPVTIKDNFDLRGIPTTAGSKMLRNAAAATTDAEAVRRLKAAGCVIVGRTNMTEFAFSGLGLNPHYGTPANPRFAHVPHIVGGSSSGAALSVASGLVPAALGTDTGGSVRIPAALCGLVGYKPTSTAISKQGVLPLSRTLDAVGIIAHTVRDCARLLGVLRSDEPRVQRDRSNRLGIIDNFVWNDVDASVCEATEQAFERLDAAGFAVTRTTLPALDGIADAMRHGTIPAAEAWAWHRTYLENGRRDEYDPRVVARIAAGEAIDEAQFERLMAWRKTFVAAFDEAACDFDALVWPTVPIVAPRIADLVDDDAAYWRANALMLRNSTIANLADACAISIPCGATPPVGLTLAAAAGQDDHLLATAAAAEAALSPIMFH
jgi:aspartyl-tRNA(Asn)/glutamyl-tRNA(Gln) amidotransferase subunit A